jgi:hypothetical protein
MENYIVIDGIKINISNETVDELKTKLDINKKLSYKDVFKNLFVDKEKGSFYISGESILQDNDWNIHNIGFIVANKKSQLKTIKALNKLMNTAIFLNDGWTVDTNDPVQDKYYIWYHVDKNELKIGLATNCIEGHVYFKSNDAAKKAIKILGEETIKKALILNHS